MEKQGLVITAGVDEAGRGPLAGPVFAAAVILNPHKTIPGLTDSKLLSEKKREALFITIKENALAWAVASADVEEIDTLNILQATMLAMQRAIAALTVVPQLVLIDGNKAPELACEAKTIIQGDLIEPAISAASILAKVTRDHFMQMLDSEYPGYGFAKHKGYSTKEHLLALDAKGVSKVHRKSFAPVTSRLPLQFVPA